MQADVTADRFYGGGLNTGQPGRAGNFLGSATQTEFRVGDVDVTDPEGSGAPLFVPDLVLWRRLGFTTGLAPIALNAPGLAVDLTPQAPTADWQRAGRGLVLQPIARRRAVAAEPTRRRRSTEMHDWHRSTAVVTGTPMPGRLGVAAGAAWTSASQQQRGNASTLDGSVGSAFAHLVFTFDPRRTRRACSRSPSARAIRPPTPPRSRSPGRRRPTSRPTLQATWQRHGQDGVPFRVFGSFTRRARTCLRRPCPPSSSSACRPARFRIWRTRAARPTAAGRSGRASSRVRGPSWGASTRSSTAWMPTARARASPPGSLAASARR